MKIESPVRPNLRDGYLRNDVNNSMTMKIMMFVCIIWFNQLKREKNIIYHPETDKRNEKIRTLGRKHLKLWGKQVHDRWQRETRMLHRH